MRAVNVIVKMRTKRARTEDTLVLNDDIEVRHCVDGNGLFSRRTLPVGWCFDEHPVCVESQPHSARRRLPHAHDVDELMEELCKPSYQREVRGDHRMSYMQRHLDMQGDGPGTLPRWARAIRMATHSYNLLAAQLQSNVATHAGGGGLILFPSLRFANHRCASAANTELCWVSEPDESTSSEGRSCRCGVGDYRLRALEAIPAGHEISFSYIGNTLVKPEDLTERQALLFRRWGFHCSCSLCLKQKVTGD